MANNTDLGINIKVNSGDSQKQLKALGNEFDNIQNKTQDINKSFQAISSASFGKSLFEGLKSLNDKFGEGLGKVDNFKSSLETLNNRVNLGTSILGHFSQRGSALGAMFGEVRTNLTRIFMPLNTTINGFQQLHHNANLIISVLQRLVPSLAVSQAQLTQLSQASNQVNTTLSGSVGNLEKTTIAVTGLAVSLGYVGKQASDTAMEFDKAMRNVNSIAQESETVYQKLFSTVRTLSDDPKIIEGPTGLAKGMYQLVSSSFSAADSLYHVAEASKSASAGLTSTETAVTAVSSLMNGYNQKTLQDGIKFNDELFRIVDKGVITFEQLAQNLGSVIPVASAANIQFKEVGASFIELTRAGVSASEAETAIAGLIKELSNPSPDAKNFAKYLGADISELAIKTKGLGGVMAELGLKTGGSLALMQKIIPESRAAKAALILASNEGKNFTRALGEMETAQGSRDRALEQQAKSSAFAYEKMKVSIEDLKIEYGKIINEAIVPMLGYLKSFIDFLKNLDQGTKETIVQVGLWTTSLASALIAVSGVILAVKGLDIALKTLMANPLILYLTMGATAIYLFHEAVKTLSNSVDGWARSLANVLKYIDLIGVAQQGIEMFKSMKQNDTEQKDKTTAKDNFNNNYTKFKRKENSGGAISLDEYKAQLKILKEYITFSKEEGGQARFDLVKNESLRINSIIKAKELDINASKEAQNQKAIDSAKFGALKEKEFENEKKRLDELKAKRKSLANEVISINEKEIEELNGLQKESYEHDIFLAEKELRYRIKTFEDAKKIGVLNNAQYLDNLGKAQAVFNAQMVKMQRELSKTLTDEFNQATKNKYDYEKIQIDKDFNEKKKYINTLKNNGVNVKNEELQNETVHNSKLKKLSDEKKRDLENDLASKKKIESDLLEFIADINDKKNDLNISEIEKEKDNNKKTLREIYKKYEDEKAIMSKELDIYGKKKFSSKDIAKFSSNFSSSYKSLEGSLKDSIETKQQVKNYTDSIDKIKEKLAELGQEEDLLRGDRLEKEKQYWNDIKNSSIKALEDLNSNLTEEQKKKIESDKIESDKQLAKNLKDKVKLAKEGNKAFSGSLQEVISDIGLLNKESANAFTSILTFENGAIEKTASLKDAFTALTEGFKNDKGIVETGLKGLLNFAKDGGDLSGIVGFAKLIVNQAKGMISAVTDNLRQPENFNDLITIANQIGEDFINTVTMGALKGTKKLLGFKDSKEIEQAKNQIFESDLKMNKDKEDVAIKTYNFQKSLAYRTIKDEAERNQKLKELDFDFNNSLYEIHKQNSDLDIQLENNKLVQIQKTFDSEKENINQSEGNWQLRNKKLEALFNETRQKFAQETADMDKLNAKLNSTNDVEKMILESKAEMTIINAKNIDQATKEKEQLSNIQDLALKLIDVKNNGWKELDTIMSNYYDKEMKFIKARHKEDYNQIQVRENAIKVNQKQIDIFQNELDKIEARYNKLLGNKDLSKASATQFKSLTENLQAKNNGVDFSALVRTPETEFIRKISANKEDIDKQFQKDGDIQKRSEALKVIAVEQNVYWENISKNLVQGTKEYDEAIKNQNDSFKDFKDAVKDGIEAQKDFDTENFKTTNGVIDLKKEIVNLTDKNKGLSVEITNYNNTIQSDLDTLTSKFKNSAGEWETDINKATSALSGLSSGSKQAIQDLDNLRAKQLQAETVANQIIKDPTKAITTSNLSTNGYNNIQGTKLESRTDYSMPTTYQPIGNTASVNNSGQLAGESVDDYINRIKKEDALAQNRPSNTKDPFASAGSNPFSYAMNELSNIGFGMARAVGFSDGGISEGASGGYMAKLHGRELILNQNQGDNLAYLLKTANNPNISNSSQNNNITYQINANGLNKNEVLQVMTEFEQKRQQMNRLAYRGS